MIGFFLRQFFAGKVNSGFEFKIYDLNFKVVFCSFISLSSNTRQFSMCVYIYLYRNKLQRSQEIILAVSQKVASNSNFYYCKGCHKIDFCLCLFPHWIQTSLSETMILLLLYPLTYSSLVPSYLTGYIRLWERVF